MFANGRRIAGAAALVAPMVLLTAAAHAGHKVEREERKIVAVDGQTEVFVQNAAGRTTVIGSEDPGQVVVVANKWVVAKSADEAQRVLDMLQIDVSTEGRRISVVVVPEKGFDEDHSLLSLVRGQRNGAFVDFTIEVPHRFDVHTVTASGDVRVTNVDGEVDVRATSGDVELRDVRRDAAIELTSGDINATDIGGNLRVAASSGDTRINRVRGIVSVDATSGSVDANEIGGDAKITLFHGNLKLGGCLGNLKFNTATGDAKISDVVGNIDASSSSGNLDVVILPVGEKKYILNTSSGNIDLVYRAVQKYGFALDVNTCTGSIRGELDDARLDKITRRTLRGIIGSGKAVVMIQTASGDVTIKETANGKKQ